MNAVSERREVLRERWNNPTVIVQSENAYSIVAKPEGYSDNRPFQRFNKFKDENGTFIYLRRDKRVYEENWKRNTSK